jgi:hypothetical protein
MDAKQIITEIYTHPALLSLISKINPKSLQDDLRQEIAVSLLEQPEARIMELNNENKLIGFTLKICWNMATSKTSQFYYAYKKNDIIKAIQYINHLQPLPEIPIHYATVATQALNEKTKDQEDYHEMLIFSKFAELGVRRKVAEYYGIPRSHVDKVVAKVQQELKSLIQL